MRAGALDLIDYDPIVAFQKENVATVRSRASESPVTVMRAAEEIESRFADPFKQFRICN